MKSHHSSQKEKNLKLKNDKKGCETVKFRVLLWVVNGKAEKNRSFKYAVRFPWLTLCSCPGGTCSDAEHKLFSGIFSNYNQYIRPVENVSDPVIVQFEVSMSQLVKVVSSKKMFFLSVGADARSVCDLWGSYFTSIKQISLCLINMTLDYSRL